MYKYCKNILNKKYCYVLSVLHSSDFLLHKCLTVRENYDIYPNFKSSYSVSVFAFMNKYYSSIHNGITAQARALASYAVS